MYLEVEAMLTFIAPLIIANSSESSIPSQEIQLPCVK